MARIRTVKPEFWSSEQVMSCSRDTRLLFIGIWNFVDDAGRCPNSEKTIKAQVFPGDEDITTADVRQWLDDLSSKELLLIYEVDGKSYLQVTGWRHQKIDRPRPSKHPAPIVEPSSNNRRSLATDPILLDRIKDPMGAGEPRAPSSNSLPQNWKPAAATIEAAKSLGLTDADLDKMLLRFGSHYRSRGEKRVNWDEQFLGWCADEASKLGRSPPQAAKPSEPERPLDPAWAPIKDKLIELIGINLFNSWFKNASIVSLEGEKFVLAAPTKFIATWWRDKFMPKIEAAVKAAYPDVRKIELVDGQVVGQPARSTNEDRVQVSPAKTSPAENAPKHPPDPVGATLAPAAAKNEPLHPSRPMPVVEPEVADDVYWPAIRQALEASLDTQTIETWFAGARVISLEGSSIIMEAGSKAAKEKWERQFLRKLGNAIQFAYPKVTEFRFEVAPTSINAPKEKAA